MRVAVLGLGLVGGSITRRLHPDHDVAGWDADPETRELAAAAGIRVEEAPDADVTIVATPLAASGDVLARLSTADCPIVTDVGSVKVPVLAAARAAGLAGRYVGGHPMAGTEHAGFAASDPAMLAGAAWVLCVEQDTDLTAWTTVAALVTGMGCRVVPTDARTHDDAQARISGLPHLLATALAVAGGGGGPLARTLAAGSFRDGTRVAGSRPELITGLCDGNRDALDAVLTDTLSRLTDARDALRAGGTVRPLAEAGHRARLALTVPAATVAVRLDATAGTFRADLADLGAAGGTVDAVRPGGELLCRRPG